MGLVVVGDIWGSLSVELRRIDIRDMCGRLEIGLLIEGLPDK